MPAKVKSRWALLVVVTFVILSVACVQLAPRLRLGDSGSGDLVQAIAVTQPVSATNANPNRTIAGRGTAVVQRGSISEVVPLTGRVAGQQEIGLEFPPSVKLVQGVAVRAGQSVDQGQLLIEGDSKDLAKDLAAARARVETSQLKLAQGQSQTQARRQEDGRRSALDALRNQSSVADAQANLERSQADLDRLKAGPTDADRAAAQANVAQAAAAFERAQADLSRLEDGPTKTELQAAQQEVANQRANLDRSNADLAKLRAGPDPADLRAAGRDVAVAQSDLARAQTELDALTNGPDQTALRNAQRDVDRAQSALRDAQAMKVDTAAARAVRDSAVRAAQTEVQAAQDRWDALRQPPRPADVDLARNKVQVAQLTLDGARDKLDRLNRSVDQASIDAATSAVSRTQSGLDTAEGRLRELQAGPAEPQLAPTRAALESARATLDNARVKAAELDGPPSPAAVRDAEAKVASAQGAVTRAAAEARVGSGSSPGGDNYDQLLLEKGLEQDRATVDSLERDLAAARLVAPFAGVITSVNVVSGDTAAPGRPVVSIAPPGERMVVADLLDQQSQVAAGQDATVQLEGAGDGDALPGRVLQVAAAPSGVGRVAYVYVEWPGDPPIFGRGAQVIATLSQHDDVLLVPEKAVRSNGARRYVEYVTGTNRKVVDVEVGITGGGSVEILRGLSEGQTVTVRP
jgi:HlyD family secretion protein